MGKRDILSQPSIRKMNNFKITKKIEAHLRNLKNYDFLLDKFKNKVQEKEVNLDPFTCILETIISQQISFKAAITIQKRFKALGYYDSKLLVKVPIEELRKVGLTKQRSEYIKNWCDEYLKNKEFYSYKKLIDVERDIIFEKMLKVKGIGTWTVETFLLYGLEHKNVTSYKDLAFKKGLEWLWSSKNIEKDFNIFIKQGTPYLTYASLLLNYITKYNLFIYPSYKDYHDYYYETVMFLDAFYLIKATNYELVSIKEIDKNKSFNNSNMVTSYTKKWLKDFESGKLYKYNLRIRKTYNDIADQVYSKLLQTDFSTTISYGELAMISGIPNAARRVGTIMATNKIPFVIPCHRVIKSDGTIGNYGVGGIKRKREILDLEKIK